MILSLLFPGGVLAEPSIVFLTRQQASQAIVDDTGEPYFSTLQPMEMAAKTGSELTAHGIQAQRQETRARYRTATLDFNTQEKSALGFLVKGIDSGLNGHYPRLSRLPWKFLKVGDNIEGGLPHTRGPYIVISSSMASQLVRLVTQYPEAQAIAVGAGILLHEHIHVLQRNDPDLFASLYRNVWGFTHVAPIRETKWLRRHHLANPDGLDCCWLFPMDKSGSRYILPSIVFAEGEYLKRMPRDFRMIALTVKRKGNRFTFVNGEDGRPDYSSLLQVEPYLRVFQLSSNIYHPNEASADLVTQLVQFSFLSDLSRIPAADRKAIERALAPVEQWADLHLL